ncbi:AfsA-related hotdog domain-containing protein [Streptomyces sp. NPDC004732]|uniref:AfsA-related hotdog domain-containing protein n=1 Tax=Streptomyces sp. NPDC004732 TaxID=3154290 RepID=UPI0033BD006E
MRDDQDRPAGAPGREHGTLRLVQRTPSWEPPDAAGPAGGEAEFALTGELPRGHPVFGDGPRRFHDLQAGAEMVREIGELLGQSLFGVPANRTGVFYRFAVRTPDIAAWRDTGTGSPALLTTLLRVRPDKVIDGVPRALEFRTDLQLDDRPCGAGTANVVFLPPVVYRNHQARGRTSPPREPAATGGAGRTAEDPPSADPPSVDPAEVGRAAPGNVLVHAPSEAAHGRLSAGIRPPAHWPLPRVTEHGHVPAAVQLEALRQTALLCAGRSHRFAPDRCALSSLEVHFRGYAEPAAPMRCAAVAGPCDRDAQGRRQVPVTLTLAQTGRAVLEAVVTVVEDF